MQGSGFGRDKYSAAVCPFSDLVELYCMYHHKHSQIRRKAVTPKADLSCPSALKPLAKFCFLLSMNDLLASSELRGRHGNLDIELGTTRARGQLESLPKASLVESEL